MNASDAFRAVMPIQAGLISIELASLEPELQAPNLSFTLRLIRWEMDGEERSLSELKEQQVDVLPGELLKDPRVPAYFRAWASAVQEQVSEQATELMPSDLFPPVRKHPLLRTDSGEEEVLRALLRSPEKRRPFDAILQPLPVPAEVEAAISRDPTNPEPYLVFADLLQEQGDPRGELMTLLVEADRVGTPAAREAGNALFARHRDALAGPLEDWESLSLDWRWGFVSGAHLSLTVEDSEEGANAAGLLRALLACPAARFLQHLTLGVTGYAGRTDYGELLEMLCAKARPALRELFIGDLTSEDAEISWVQAGNLGALPAAAPRLSSLKVRAGQIELGPLGFPHLKRLVLESGGLSLECLRAVCAADWPRLEHLELWFGSSDYGAGGGVADLEDVLEARRIPKVRSLGLRNAEFTDELVARLVDSPVLVQLEELDLSLGTLSDAGARTLALHAGRFKHLRWLGLDQNYLTEEGVALVEGVCPRVTTRGQKAADAFYDEGARYVSVGE